MTLIIYFVIIITSLILGLIFLYVILIPIYLARLITKSVGNKLKPNAKIILVDNDKKRIVFKHNSAALMPGKYSMWFLNSTGHAQIGEIISQNKKTVTRKLLAINFGNLYKIKRVRINGWWFAEPNYLNIPYHNVDIVTNLGLAPAWLFPANSNRWAILIHGHSSNRKECLRAVSVMHQNGYNVLIISFRNDGEAPYSADGRSHLGATEWQDMVAAYNFLKNKTKF